MTVVGVGVAPSNETLVLLRDVLQQRFLPIWIGATEAVAIQMGLDAHAPLQPSSHDLAATVLRQLNAELRHVTISYMKDKIFYSCLHLESAGETYEVDARPSDAIALALRTQSPIFVSSDILEHMGAWDEEEDPIF